MNITNITAADVLACAQNATNAEIFKTKALVDKLMSDSSHDAVTHASLRLLSACLAMLASRDESTTNGKRA